MKTLSIFNNPSWAGSRALVSNSAKNLVESVVTSTELGYLDGVTSAIQTQLNGKAASSHTHTIANVTSLQTALDAKVASTELANLNYGTAFESPDPFTSRASYSGKGGVRTGLGAGPFGSYWYNMVDIRHRNTMTAGDIWGGELVWGMTGATDRMAFRSRIGDGTPTAWIEAWTKANLPVVVSGSTVSAEVLQANNFAGGGITLTGTGSVIDLIVSGSASIMDITLPYATVTASATLESRTLSIINSSTDRIITLPTPVAGKIMKLAVQTSGATGHRLYPASGHSVYFSGMYQTTHTAFVAYASGISGGYALLLKPGNYELIGVSSTEWTFSSGPKTYA